MSFSSPRLFLQVSKVTCDSKDTLLSPFSPPKLSEILIYKINLMLHTQKNHNKRPTKKQNKTNKQITNKINKTQKPYKVISAKILACRDQLKILSLWSSYTFVDLSGEGAAH